MRGRKKGFSERLFVNHSFNLAANVQSDVALFTATVPCTVRHVLTRLNTLQNAAGATDYASVISNLPEGFASPNSITLTSGQALYKPEEFVMAYTTGIVNPLTSFLPDTLRGGTRKLQVGDRIFISVLSTAAGVSSGTSELIVSS